MNSKSTIDSDLQLKNDSIVSSTLSEKRWIDQLSKSIAAEALIDMDSPPSVFQVPKSIRDTKPEPYAPQKFGLGPYHHLKPDLYLSQRRKISAVKSFLTPEHHQNFQHLVAHLSTMEPTIRAFYDKYIDLDGHTLSWILALDGIYLLHYLSNLGTTEPNAGVARDIMIMENQIPTFVLDEILKALKALKTDDPDNDQDLDEMLEIKALQLCRIYSPLKLARTPGNCGNLHLLDQLYNLIVNKSEIWQERINPFLRSSPIDDMLQFGSIVTANLDVIGGGRGAELQKHCLFLQKLPWGKICEFCGIFRKESKESDIEEEIKIPSVSELVEIAKIKFKLISGGGIRDIKFEKENGVFKLPVITLNEISEVVLRNLVAYEAAKVPPGSTLELAEYVDLMCGIVDTPKDVSLLRKEGIIQGSLSDEEIAKIFNGIRRTTGESKKKSEIEKAVDQVNEKFDNTTRVKVSNTFRKYVYGSWKFLTMLSTILLLCLLTLQTFCQVYGCSSRCFHRGAVSLDNLHPSRPLLSPFHVYEGSK